MITSLEVARQFGMQHCNLVSKIERLIRNDESMRKYYKRDYYEGSKKQKYVMYVISKEGY